MSPQLEPTARRRVRVPRTSRTRGAVTRDRLLHAAIGLFAERGYAAVSVRDLSRAAHSNLAAVNYHFGGKLGLYREVVRSAIEMMRATSELTMQAADDASAEARLRRYFAAYVPRLMTIQGPGAWIHRLMRHEMAKPTPAVGWIVEEAIRPRLRYLSQVVADLLDCQMDDPRVMRCVISIQAQCLTYIPDPFRSVALGRDWPPRTPAAIEAIIDHLFAFSLAGIRAIEGAKPSGRRGHHGRPPRAAQVTRLNPASVSRAVERTRSLDCER
jgi:AcrR family transcriptional regulator